MVRIEEASLHSEVLYPIVSSAKSKLRVFASRRDTTASMGAGAL